MSENLKFILKAFANDLKNIFGAPQTVIDFLRHYFLYLVWVLLVPLMLYKMSQGRELFTGLFDDHTFFTAFRAMMLLGIFFVQALVILLLPRPFFRHNGVAGTTDSTAFKQTDWERFRPTVLRNPGLQYLLSALPALLYGLVMIVVQRDRIPAYGWPLIALTLGGAALAAYWFEEKWRGGVRKILLLILANMALCMGFIWFMPHTMHRFWNYFILGGCLMFQLALIGGLSNRLSEEFKHLTKSREPRWGNYDRLYLFVFVFLVGFITFATAVPNVEPVSPTFILLALTTFYLLMSTLLTAFYRFKIDGKKKWYAWVFWGLFLGACAVVFRLGAPIHDVKTISQDVRLERRVGFDDWFKDWVEGLDTTQQEIPIYLVAVQGGGSRAGFWASEILNRLEVESGYRFHRHCLAITSASGGSSGTGATLAMWRYARDSSEAIERIARALAEKGQLEGGGKDSLRKVLHLRFSEGFFQRNYLSNSFFDLFVTEVGTSFLSFSEKRYDRNYGHQKNEALGLTAGIRRGIIGAQDSTFSDVLYRVRSMFQRGDRPSLCIQGKTYTHNYAFDSYLSYWYTPDGKPRPEWPLYFPITTNVHTGQCGYPSPVVMEPALFSDAVDLLSAVDASHPGQTLSLVGATNLSQLFPVMNAFTFIPNSGNYLDGGVFENMGLPLMQELCKRVDHLVQNAPYTKGYRHKIRIKLLFLLNNGLTYSEAVANKPAIKRKFQPTMIISFLSGAAMGGRTLHFMANTPFSVPKSVEPTSFVLQYPHPQTKETDHVPLGRWLSKRSLKTMEARADSLQKEIERVVRDKDGN